MFCLQDIVEILNKVIERNNQLEVARALGISPQYLNDVIHYKHSPGRKLLSALGYGRIVFYQVVGNESPGIANLK